MISDTAVYGWATEERLDQASQRDGQLGPKLGPTRSVRDHIAVSPAAGDLESQLRSTLHNGSADLGVKVSVACPGWVQSGIYAASPTLNVRREQMQSALPFKLMETDTAAQRILAGVARNQPVIIFPLYARMLWWVYRMRITWLNALGLRMIRDLRRLRMPTEVEQDRV